MGQLIVSTRECPPQLLPTAGIAHLPASCDLSGNSGCTHTFPFNDCGSLGKKALNSYPQPQTQTSPSPGPGWCWDLYPPLPTTPLAVPWLLSYSHNSKGVPTLKGWGLCPQNLLLNLPCTLASPALSIWQCSSLATVPLMLWP